MTPRKHAFRTDLVFGAVVVTAALTLVLFAVVAALERAGAALAAARQADAAGERAAARARGSRCAA